MKAKLLDGRLCTMHGACMPTKTISLETDAYALLKRAKLRGESFSDVVRRTIDERPAETLGELELAMKHFEGVSVRRKKGRDGTA